MSIIKTLNKAHILGIDFDVDKLEAEVITDLIIRQDPDYYQGLPSGSSFDYQAYKVYFSDMSALHKFLSRWHNDKEPNMLIQNDDSIQLTPFDKTNG